MHIWTLKRGAERRFRGGHPWVFNNELAHSPGAVAPGDPVELRDAAGGFLGRGYGHPHTLIAFRALSRNPAETAPWTSAALLSRLRRAAGLRRLLGLADGSHRVLFGEADGIPGLVVDRYRLTGGDGPPRQAFALQQHTAGAERLHAPLLEALQALVDEEHAADATAPAWADSSVVLRNDVAMRRLDELEEQPPAVLRCAPGENLAQASIVAPQWLESHAAPALRVDLVEGQKTGFYLDQAANVRLAAHLLAARLRSGAATEPLRILDLFAYIGQWGAQLARVALAAGREVQVTAVDASAPALALAELNVRACGAAIEPLRADVLRGLNGLPSRSYDVVVVDPPAFIKGRKALPTGRSAYVKVNALALSLLRPGGLLVTCSCSQLLPEQEFLGALHKAGQRAATPMRWVARGGQAPDHPVLAGFPEGNYLKCWIGVAG